MRRIMKMLVLASVLVLGTVTAAVAQNPHYVSGPTFTADGNSVTATGSVAGLGNQNIDVLLEVVATQTVQCRNPGGNIAPGQTQTLNASNLQQNLEVRNGRVNFTITATPIGYTEQQLRDRGACPNARWTPIPGDVVLQSATLTIFQPTGSGNAVLTTTHTF